MHDTQFVSRRKTKIETQCRICGPLVCRAETEGLLGHIAFFIYISSFLIISGLLMMYIASNYNIIIIQFIKTRISDMLLIAATFSGGLRIFIEGFEELIKHREFDIDLLVFSAAIGAILIGFYLEAALVVNLFVIADYLESIAVSKAEKEIEKLTQYFPNTARVIRNGEEKEVPSNLIKIGELIIVKPGERIPLDGTIIEGEANIDQSVLTGESIPVYKTVGEEVFAGTFCMDGRLIIKVKRRAEESLFNKIIDLVLKSQKQKTEIETFIEKFSKYYVPIILILAFTVMIGGSLLFSEARFIWIYKGLILLVLSCPCALAISVPAGMISGIVNAARKGILIKGSKFLERASEAKVVALDKTGTLTKGELVVREVIPLTSKYTVNYVLSLATSLEKASNHPISRAVVEHANSQGLKLLEVSRFREYPGKGIHGVVNGKTLIVGNLKLLEEFNIPLTNNVISIAKEKDAKGAKTIFVCENRGIIGLIVLSDELKPEAKRAIKEIKKQGIRTIMLTGDNKDVATSIARELEIDEYHADLLPHEKVKIIKKLSQKYGSTIFAGDGVNDAPAISSADVGIAMGMRGIDVSIETADIVLANDDLMNIPYLIELSKVTKKAVRFNVILSIFLKFVLVILALLGFITLIEAVAFGDDGLALVVTFNSMRILRYKSKNLM